MANEQGLALLAGRTIQGTQNKNGAMILHFSDGSTLTAETGPSASNSAATGGTIRAVRLSETALHLELEKGAAMQIPLAGQNAALHVVDKNGVTEYDAKAK